MVDRVADILALTYGHDHNRDELRSLAMGWLVRPADLLKLLVTHSVPDEAEDSAPVWAPAHTAQTVAHLAGLTPRQLAAFRPRAVVHVHLTDEALRSRSGIARVEDLGPQLVERLAELLGHADVRLQPVRDLNARIRVDQYEHPTPYDKDGPPGQTGSHNSAPLRRTHHRWKTFGGYRCRQAGPGRYLWATPLGQFYLRDHTGTRRLDPEDGALILEAPRGVDIYPGQ